MKIVIICLALSLLALMPVSGMCKSDNKEAGASTAGVMSGSDDSSAETGIVVETMDAGGYTYSNLKKNNITGWVASPRTSVSVGQELSFTGCMPMADFHSKALNRTFPTIKFCSAIKGNVDAEQLKKKSTGSKVVAPTSDEKIAIQAAKGKDAHTVVDCYAKSTELDKKVVEVRGKVMKVSNGIMGMNWAHIQDGTGSPATNNNNLVVTMKEDPEVGSIITILGTLAKNKDFGSGYKYDVIVEQATIK
ncbi:DNA-binding protein [Candidatus Roizmanbacteria bacterium]|nr:DNA-binding protein [Candidatus Roizmanbacteria bacterium]